LRASATPFSALAADYESSALYNCTIPIFFGQAADMISWNYVSKDFFFFKMEAKELPHRLIKKKRNCPVN
jgi:hypothetical protein